MAHLLGLVELRIERGCLLVQVDLRTEVVHLLELVAVQIEMEDLLLVQVVDPEDHHNLLVLAKLLGELAQQVANLRDHLIRILKQEKNVSLSYADQDKIKKMASKK